MRHNVGGQQGGGVDWYTPPAGQGTAYGNYSNQGYGGASTSGYGTTDNFEDEPPLLEGESCCEIAQAAVMMALRV